MQCRTFCPAGQSCRSARQRSDRPKIGCRSRDLNDPRRNVECEDADAVHDVLVGTGNETLFGIDVVGEHDERLSGANRTGPALDDLLQVLERELADRLSSTSFRLKLAGFSGLGTSLKDSSSSVGSLAQAPA